MSTPNTLIKQSLQATRVAQSLKKAEQRLEKERVLEVLRSSTGNSGARRARSISPTKGLENDRDAVGSSSASASGSSAGQAQRDRRPTLPPRPRVSPPPSTAASVRSLEEVAHAALPPFRRPPPSLSDAPIPPPEHPARPARYNSMSPSRTPPRPLSELPPEPPPTHPHRKLSVVSEGDRDRDLLRERGALGQGSPNSPRVLRSKSLHHPTPPPLPPPRRPRPESAQISPAPSSVDLATSVTSAPPHRTHGRTASQGGLSRHLSISSSRSLGREASPDPASGATSPFAHLQRTFSTLQQRAAPKLDAARFKAEAGLTRRGFVQRSWPRQEGEERLMDEAGPGMDEGGGRAERDAYGYEYADEEGDVDVDVDSALEVDSSEGEEEWERRLRQLKMQHGETSAGAGSGAGVERTSRGRVGMERDEMKWPVSENDGWKPL
ncbi:hypothetical protein CERSUDRAFT_116684 [Gelatoporia subvermispora B]|uniref:Uncharacterized protein n=1 Tax=Ceriporiopsis subvermispora (strain B) TaxID=914234 RepID=M2R783_CERS8|nr:hypothetical protein CERSUDRAFT_116684 [Gelatoporia subvermispora B]